MFGIIQRVLPRRRLTQMAGFLASKRLGCLTRLFVRLFIRHYQVNMSEALESNYRYYATFNAFFSRALKPEARPVDDADKVIVSPVDGALGAVGSIRHETLLQAKGRFYSLAALLAQQQRWVDCFSGGYYATAYLSPKDYHRVHMPIAGRLREMIFVPGDFYSVNESSISSVDAVFARNERVICVFDTPIGEMAVILIGAMIVGSMVMKWCGDVRSSSGEIVRVAYDDKALQFNKGDELGYFQLGSSVILLFQSDVVDGCFLDCGASIMMGQGLIKSV